MEKVLLVDRPVKPMEQSEIELQYRNDEENPMTAVIHSDQEELVQGWDNIGQLPKNYGKLNDQYTIATADKPFSQQIPIANPVHMFPGNKDNIHQFPTNSGNYQTGYDPHAVQEHQLEVHSEWFKLTQFGMCHSCNAIIGTDVNVFGLKGTTSWNCSGCAVGENDPDAATEQTHFDCDTCGSKKTVQFEQKYHNQTICETIICCLLFWTGLWPFLMLYCCCYLEKKNNVLKCNKCGAEDEVETERESCCQGIGASSGTGGSYRASRFRSHNKSYGQRMMIKNKKRRQVKAKKTKKRKAAKKKKARAKKRRAKRRH